jgi:hypothetical protein
MWDRYRAGHYSQHEARLSVGTGSHPKPDEEEWSDKVSLPFFKILAAQLLGTQTSHLQGNYAFTL